jgi:hypothetical protein
MKLRGFSAFTVVACAMAVGLSAQTPPAGGQQPAGERPSASGASKVTITGCLEKASGSSAPTGTSGAAGAASSAKFVLNNASSGGSSASPGAAGTSGAATASSYRLDGDDSKLSPHVGHKVEITGSVQGARPSAGKSGEPGAAPGAAGAASSAGGPTLKVDAVKMVASSCTP